MARPPDVLVAPPGLLPRPAASSSPVATETSQITRPQRGSKPGGSSLPLRRGRATPSPRLHLVSLELGGARNDPRNLWPELNPTHPGPNPKDALENHLHAQVCDGTMRLAAAQLTIARHWVSAYRQYKAGR
jgi:hypothetical protein